nr:retrovirus-related Pol polyprotein from transposon TNT 1-94 [Tanacetum cinerariifolium]
MLVAQEVEEGDADENVKDVNDGDAAEGDVSAANEEVPTTDEEPSIPSPIPLTPPSQPSQDIPSTSQVQPTPPQSPQVQPQSPQPQPPPTQDARIPMNLLQEVMDTCTALTRRVEHLELDKIAQALEITKLKQKVKKLERRNKGRMIAEMDVDADVVQEEAKEVANDAKADQDAKEDKSESAKVQEAVDVVTTAKLITEVVTAASITITAAEVPVPAATTTAAASTLTAAPKRRIKGGGPKLLKKQAQLEQDEQYARELKAELNRTTDWDEVIDHVKMKAKEDPTGKSFEKHFDSNVAFLQKTKGQIEEEESRALQRINETPTEKVVKMKKLDEEVEELKRHLQIVPNEDDDVYTKATLLARKVPVVGYKIIEQNNKPYYKIIRVDAGYTCSNLEKSKKCTWSSKSKGLEAVGILWCTDHYIYNHTADFVSREEVPTHKVHYGLDVKCPYNGTNKIRAFMEIAEDEPSVGKADARSSQWVDITMKNRKNLVNKSNLLKQELSLHKFELCNLKNNVSINCSLQNEVIIVNLENESLKDEISDLKESLKNRHAVKLPLTNCSLSKYPTTLSRPYEEEIRAALVATLNSLISLDDLTLNMADLTLKTPFPKKTKPTSDKVLPTHAIKKKTETKSPTVPESGPKVVFGDNSSGDIEIYGLVNCNVITFTRVAYVNGPKHNLINISQLDHLGKFDEKADDGLFIGYSLMAKAFKNVVFFVEPLEFTSADDHPAFNELDLSKSDDILKPVKIQDTIINEPISDVQPSPTILPSAESGFKESLTWFLAQSLGYSITDVLELPLLASFHYRNVPKQTTR